MAGAISYLFQHLISMMINIDLGIQHWLQVNSISWLSQTLAVITNLGSPTAFIMISCLVFIGLGRQKRWREAIFSYSCMVSAWSLMALLKSVFERPRPLGETFTVATGFSFPSGHAMLSLAYYGFLVLMVLKYYPAKWRPLLLAGFGILIVSIGFSRIYLNVHYTSDVLAGYIFGALVLAANWWAMKYMDNPSDSRAN